MLKRLSFPLIPSFVSSSSVVGRLMALLTFPIMAALRLEEHRIATNILFVFFWFLIVCVFGQLNYNITSIIEFTRSAG